MVGYTENIAKDRRQRSRRRIRVRGALRRRARFARQLSTLLEGGVPLLRGIETLQRQERDVAFRTALVDVAASVRGGSSLSEALALYPTVFDRLFTAMVRAGEAQGRLPDVLKNIATSLERGEATRQRLRAAMVYPAVVLSVAVIIVGLLIFFVAPRFQVIFSDILRGAELPVATRIVLELGETLQARWLWMIAFCLGSLLGWRGIRNWEVASLVLDRAWLNVPVLGRLLWGSALSRFSRTLSGLMASGVPILDALRMAGSVTGNRWLEAIFDEVRLRVRDGGALAQSLDASQVFPELLVSMVDVGEESGTPAEMLDRVAEHYDDETTRAISGMISVIEPMLIVLLAVVIGGVVIALFLPIITIIQSLGT